MRPAVILARVSTPEQEAGHSLEAQLANLQDYAQRKGLEVVQVFRIIESSTKGYRPEFEQMIDFLKRQKQRHALIVDCVDRLQRSFTHTPVLNGLMEKNLLEVHFVREGNVIDKDANSMQKMMWNMGTVMAQSYTDQLADNVRRSIKHKLEKGEWIAQAPLGYLNAIDPATGKNTVVIDPQRAPLIQKLFSHYAAGVSSLAELSRQSKEWGLLTRKNQRLAIQTVANILSNPFYSGLMRIKGKLYPHSYPRIIEPSLFEACERRKRNTGLPQKAVRSTKHPFLLRGLVKCAASGRKATCALQKRRYVYLMVRNPTDQKQILWVKEDGVIDQITNVLHSFAMPDSLLTEVQAYIKQSDAADKELALDSLKDLREEQKQLTGKLSRMADLLIDGSIDKSIYDAKQREIIFRKAEIDQRLQQIDKPQQDDPDALGKLVTMTARSAEIFRSSKTEEKRLMLGFVFSNLALEGASLRYSLRKPFDKLQQVPKNPEWRPLRPLYPCLWTSHSVSGCS